MITLANKPTISEKTDDCKVGIVVATGDLNTVLQGRAPATGITIEQTVDYAISKINAVNDFLCQDTDAKYTFEESVSLLEELFEDEKK